MERTVKIILTAVLMLGLYSTAVAETWIITSTVCVAQDSVLTGAYPQGAIYKWMFFDHSKKNGFAEDEMCFPIYRFSSSSVTVKGEQAYEIVCKANKWVFHSSGTSRADSECIHKWMLSSRCKNRGEGRMGWQCERCGKCREKIRVKKDSLVWEP